MKIFDPVSKFTVFLGVVLGFSIFLYKPDPVIQKVTYGFTNAQVEEVYHSLYIQSGLGSKPPLIILDSPILNAWTDGQTVNITTGLLNKMNTVDEVAMVLGHELGHVINYDIQHGAMEQVLNYHINQSYKEAAADKIGAFIMMRAGYDECKGARIMKVFRDNFGSDAAGEWHPDNAFRVDELNLPQCQGSFLNNWF